MAANNDILALFSIHVSAINSIYKNTRFQTLPENPISNDGPKCFIGVNFRIQRTTVSDDVTISLALRDIITYCLQIRDYDVINFFVSFLVDHYNLISFALRLPFAHVPYDVSDCVIVIFHSDYDGQINILEYKSLEECPYLLCPYFPHISIMTSLF